jgi:type IV pilus assembly protein PilV
MTRLRHDGFTLIEIMIAICLLGIALVGLASVSVMVIHGNAFSKSVTTATILAEDKIEELKSTGYTNLASGGPETLEAIYTRSWTVTGNSPGTGMTTIAVTVTWPWQGQNHITSLNTIIANPL